MARSERTSSRPCSGLGAERENFVSSTIRLAVRPRREDLAAAQILTLAARHQGPAFPAGALHYAGADTVTWYGFATTIFAGRRGSAQSPESQPTIADRRRHGRTTGPLIRCSTRQARDAPSALRPRPLRASLIATLERLLETGRSVHERHHPRRRFRRGCYPITHRHLSKQLLAALRQADDLLSACRC